MKTIKCLMLTIAIAIALIAIGGTDAMAQGSFGQQTSAVGPILSPVEPITIKIRSIEISGGTIGFDKGQPPSSPMLESAIRLPLEPPQQVLFGYSFLGRSSGELPGSFMLSMNCRPAIFEPGGSNELVGGTFTLPVYLEKATRGSNYQGALYGQVTGGKMSWDKTGTLATVEMNFTVDGGTQNLSDRRGEGVFQGILTEGEKGSTLDGELMITFN
jgi:hypothetical protein